VHEQKRPAPDVANKLMEKTKEKGLLIGKGGLYGNVIRITPHLNISRADAETALRIIDESLAEIRAGVSE